MSYARWLNSDWYVFWIAGTEDLAMWHCGDGENPSASYQQLQGIAEMLDDQLAESALAWLVPNAPREAVPELLEYVRAFCADVETKRKEKS